MPQSDDGSGLVGPFADLRGIVGASIGNGDGDVGADVYVSQLRCSASDFGSVL